MMQKKNPIEIMSRQVLNWAKKIETKRAQKAILTTIQENSEFDKIRHIKPPNETSLREDVYRSVRHLSQEDSSPLGRDVQDVGRTTTSRWSARTPIREHSRRIPRKGTEQREQ